MGKREMRFVSSAGALALALALTTGAASAQTETVRLGGDRIGLWNLAGDVEVVRGEGTDVVVRVVRGGRDGERLRLETGSIDGRETLRVVYPGDEVRYRPEGGGGMNTTLRVRNDGTFGDGRDGGRRVRVSTRGDGVEAWADLRVEVPAGRDVRIYQGVGEIVASGVVGDLHLDTGAGRVEARDIRGRLGVDTGSGSVGIARVEGAVDVDTGSGSIRVEDVSGERLVLDTGSGSVRGSGLRAGSVLVDTGSGGVTLLGLSSPDVQVDTGSGSVEIDLTSRVERLLVDTGSGSVTVGAPEDLGARLDLDSGSGGIDLDFPLQDGRVGRDHAAGRIGDGRGEISIDTGSGRIRLHRR